MTEFVTNHHQHFTGGVFFVSARNRHFMRGAEEKIKQVKNKIRSMKIITSTK